MTRVSWGMALALGVLGCGDSPARSGRIEVAWTGADTGRFEAAVLARWCAEDSLIEIIGESGDSGVAVALFPADSLRAGAFPVGTRSQDMARPHARVALRWVSETLVVGYYSLSGLVTVDRGTEVAGRVEATLKSVVDRGQLNLTGTFREVTVTPGPAGCGSADSTLPYTGVR